GRVGGARPRRAVPGTARAPRRRDRAAHRAGGVLAGGAGGGGRRVVRRGGVRGGAVRPRGVRGDQGDPGRDAAPDAVGGGGGPHGGRRPRLRRRRRRASRVDARRRRGPVRRDPERQRPDDGAGPGGPGAPADRRRPGHEGGPGRADPVRGPGPGAAPAGDRRHRVLTGRRGQTATGSRSAALACADFTFCAYTSTYSRPDSSISSYMISSVTARSMNRSPAIPWYREKSSGA